MTSCLNHDYLILIFIHFPYLFYENPSFINISEDRIFFDKILVSEYKLSNIPASPAYGVYITQLIRYARASSNYSDFLKRHLYLRNRLLDQGYKKIRLIRS
jgi:hypothetical protein